jgi:hypothetical protein
MKIILNWKLAAGAQAQAGQRTDGKDDLQEENK